MKILVADSGSTKTDWVLVGSEERQNMRTAGLNPHLLTAEDFLNILTHELKPNLMGEPIKEIHFYGSGCSTTQKKKDVEQYLSEVFESAKIKVYSDLDGAGLALFGDREGIICSLGSETRAGFYEKGKISKQMPPVVYPHGGLGSSSYIGQKLLISYLNGQMSKQLRDYFEQREVIDLKKLYLELQKPKETKLYLGKVCKIFEKKSAHSEVQGIIFEGFSEFLNNLTKFFPNESQQYEIGFVGSIASVFEGELRACAKQKGVQLYSVVRNPIEHIGLQYSR